MKILVILFVCKVVFSDGDVDTCLLGDGKTGVCKKVEDCSYALDLLKRKINPEICSFNGQDTIVCCSDDSTNTKEKRKPGEISLKKCDEFYSFNGVIHRGISNGKHSPAKEYPHMAAVGYESDDGIQWGCGGTLISETFVLTAAHCLFSRSTGPAKHVRLGDLDLASTADDAQPQQILVKRAIAHPDFSPPSKYHDIGLLELETPINRTPYVNVACLDTNRINVGSSVLVTGWGKTEFAGKPSNFLLEGFVGLVPGEECQKYYKTADKATLAKGIDDETMVCAGGDSDTCQGDSGGPLFVGHPRKRGWDKVYNIVGITSFGKACGIAKIPGVYTRVYKYLQWIEDNVWPQ